MFSHKCLRILFELQSVSDTVSALCHLVCKHTFGCVSVCVSVMCPDACVSDRGAAGLAANFR